MNLTAIPIIQDKDHYYVFVGDEEIKMNELFIYLKTNEIFRRIHPQIGTKDTDKKIEYQSKPIHEGIPVIWCLPWIENAEKIAKEFYKLDNIGHFTYDNIQQSHGFRKGYSKHAETYPFTEKDMRKAFNEGFANGNDQYEQSDGDESFYDSCFNRFIQSLRQPKVYEVEFEMIEFEVDMGLGEECVEHVKEIKLNSEGKPIIKSWKQI